MGVWIETSAVVIFLKYCMSHPVWVCGLKPRSDLPRLCPSPSHPVWVCGLKLNVAAKLIAGLGVTPCMGVWIETP